MKSYHTNQILKLRLCIFVSGEESQCYEFSQYDFQQNRINSVVRMSNAICVDQMINFSRVFAIYLILRFFFCFINIIYYVVYINDNASGTR